MHDTLSAGEDAAPPCRGFLVHAWTDRKRSRVYLTGRLTDGRSFAAAEPLERPAFHVYAGDLERARSLLARVPGAVFPPDLASFEGREDLALLVFADENSRSTAFALLEQAGIHSPDGGEKPHLAWLSRRGIRGPVEIRGASRAGRLVDVVFPAAEVSAFSGTVPVPLRIASIDIETDTKDDSIRAVAISISNASCAETQTLVRLCAAPGPRENTIDSDTADGGPALFRHADERALLAAFVDDIQRLDPDVLTGWNFLDFDFPRLAARAEKWGVPFALGRSGEEAKFFPGESGADGGVWSGRRRSAAALVPGRQVIDSLRIVRFSAWGGGLASFSAFADFTLQTAAEVILGEGKSVTLTGDEKIAGLDRLYAEDSAAFARYCARDAELVLRILEKTGLFRLTLERATLTGVFLDKAWTSVAAFERVYGMELFVRRIAPPLPLGRAVSGAAGGTILEGDFGFFHNVAVFDFRSLYPTIMLTFNIDPLSHARAENTITAADGSKNNTAGEPGGGVIAAPNGALFSRERGLLPALIERYFAARREALDAGDSLAASVYKILMNSFYGVLGTPSCRYGRTELAGAITSFARKWLLLSREWFSQKGYRVLYGDTDSLFVETGLPLIARYAEFERCAADLARELNGFLAERIREEYGLMSFLEIRFEKAYRSFLIPPLRNGAAGTETRGRAKGYSGWLLDAEDRVRVEVKGMEAVRSDTTPLARRLQLELLELVFSGADETVFRVRVQDIIRDLRAGKLDAELVYRKRLSRPPEAYTASTPPQVKAARALGWKGRRGTVAFVWTVNGPEPLTLAKSPYDYDHYTDSQVLPVARSIADALFWHGELFPEKGRYRDEAGSGQMELGY